VGHFYSKKWVKFQSKFSKPKLFDEIKVNGEGTLVSRTRLIASFSKRVYYLNYLLNIYFK